MKLESFQVKNFRSIIDSSLIDVSRITAILGRNESGKSNLLLALKSLNPVGGIGPLNPIKDFPRHRRLEECNDKVLILTTKWLLTAGEQVELAKILPRASTITHVSVGRNYGGQRWVSLGGLKPIELNQMDVKSKIRKIVASVKAAAEKLEDEASTNSLIQAADSFEQTAAINPDLKTWSSQATKASGVLRKALATHNTELPEKQEQSIVELEDLASSILVDEEAHSKAQSWIVDRLPLFIYLDEYPELNGHQNISEYLARKKNNSLLESDVNFEKMCKVAGLYPQELQKHLDEGRQETRSQLANRASAVITGEIKRLWKDRPLKIRFNLDADHLDTLISDPNATFDVEVNLDERSRGFKWFFSFYITFAADTKGGKAEDAILLHDEPGLYLHAKSQGDLLRHFETDFKNQILYTTHSPFLVPTQMLDSVRTVNITETEGTTVTNDPTGDAKTLFPLQAALGYDLSQSLFIGRHNLVVEGVTDYWILSAVSEYLRENGKTALDPDLILTPAGGAQKVPYMVALLTSERLNVLVMLDSERDSKSTKDEIVKTKLIREENVVFVSEALPNGPCSEADIEDLFDPVVYEEFVNESYRKELNGKKISLNLNIPRIAKRHQVAFSEVGLEFHKTRTTRLMLKKMSATPEAVVTSTTAERFEKLFNLINKRLAKHISLDRPAFT